MSYMEMFVAVVAVVLFASMALLLNRSMVNQTDLITNATQYMQASHLNHTILDEIDAKLFSKQLKFSLVKTNYNITRTYNLQHAGGTWIAQIVTVDCDSLGNLMQIPNPNNIYLRVRINTSTAGLRNPVISQRIYTKTHMNL